MNAKPKRRWLQFSLRGLLLLMAVVAVPLGWTVHKVRQQGIAVAALEKMGCTVQYRSDDGRSPSSLERLRELFGEDKPLTVKSVIADINGDPTEFSDTGLVHLQGLTQLQWLNLDRTQITDAGLVHLQGLTQLHGLFLSGTQITDAGLAHLHGLNQLEYLTLTGTHVSGAGVEELRKALPNLGGVNRRD